MRVLFISGADDKYGAPRTLMELIHTLTSKYPIEAIVLTKRHNKVNKWCDLQGIENYSYWYRDIMAASAYRHSVLNICKHGVKWIGYLWGGITQNFLLKKYPELSNIDLIHTNLNRLDIGWYLAAKCHVPHICHLRELRSGHSKIVAYTPDVEKKMDQKTDKFIAISDITKKNWVMSGLSENKIELIYNGIAISNYKPAKHTDFSKLKIVCTGRIEENKGQAQIIQAVGRLPHAVKARTELILIGESYYEYRKYLMQLIRKNKLDDQVKFMGYCSNIEQILQNCNIGITCSKGEAFGRVTVEYMASGLLVLVSNTGANEELITHMQNGLVYEYGNIEDLSHKLNFIFENPSVCTRLIKESLKTAENFSLDRTAQKVYEVYQEITTNHLEFL